MIGVLRRLLAEAKAQPWKLTFEAAGRRGILSDAGCQIQSPGETFDAADAALIVAAVNGLPGLLDRLEAAENVARAALKASQRRTTCVICAEADGDHADDCTLAAWSVPDDTEEA